MCVTVFSPSLLTYLLYNEGHRLDGRVSVGIAGSTHVTHDGRVCCKRCRSLSHL